MRKLLSIACVALVVATLASCKKTYVTNLAAQSWISDPVKPNQWSQTIDGRADSVDIPVRNSANFFKSSTDATLVYFSFYDRIWEQIPEAFNGVSYSYFHYKGDNGDLHIVLYAQQTNGSAPVKPVDDILVKLVTIPAQE